MGRSQASGQHTSCLHPMPLLYLQGHWLWQRGWMLVLHKHFGMQKAAAVPFHCKWEGEKEVRCGEESWCCLCRVTRQRSETKEMSPKLFWTLISGSALLLVSGMFRPGAVVFFWEERREQCKELVFDPHCKQTSAPQWIRPEANSYKQEWIKINPV